MSSSESATPKDLIRLRRSASLPGVEVFDAINTGLRLNWFHTAFGLGIPTTWQGQIRYRGRQQTVGPGMALCTSPGELHAMPRVEHAGTYNAVMLEEKVFFGYAAEHGVDPAAIEWRVLAERTSRRLAERFARFLTALDRETSAMQLQSSLIDVVEAMTQELLVAGERRVAEVSTVAVRRMREMLHSSEGAKLDLETLASGAGMSRFQALRAFKQQYGLPPHAYQICAQLGRSRTLLRAGYSAADVAHACGFADQSHFGRAFKRAFGITPGNYARGSTPRSIASDSPERAHLCPRAVELERTVVT
jgi:AraC-like DNA-binding protein